MRKRNAIKIRHCYCRATYFTVHTICINLESAHYNYLLAQCLDNVRGQSDNVNYIFLHKVVFSVITALLNTLSH